MSAAYLCGLCRRDTIQWRNAVHPLRPCSEPRWRSSHSHPVTASRPTSGANQTPHKKRGGPVQDGFNSSTPHRFAQVGPDGKPHAPVRRPLQARTKQFSWGKYKLPKEEPLLEKIQLAITARDPEIAETVWRGIDRWNQERHKCIEEAAKSTTHAESGDVAAGTARKDEDGPTSNLCSRLLIAFLSLGRPEKADEVWESMMKANLVPHTYAWNDLLVACRDSRNSVLLEKVWARICATGYKPDMIHWTTRIHGLISCRQFRQGMQALNEMGQIWRMAAEQELSTRGRGQEQVSLAEMGDIGRTVKPTTKTINVVLHALLRHDQIQLAQAMLHWATSLGIQPDIDTFNALLKYLVDEDFPERALELYRGMEAAGVTPDISTFTVVFDGYYKSSAKTRPSPGENRDEMVTEIFREMERAGIPATLHTYSIFFHNFLSVKRPAGANIQAAKAMLKYMFNKGIQPNAHINTSLAQYFFSLDPPDLDALDALWQRVRLRRSARDEVLLEMLIDGFARVGKVSHALDAFRMRCDEQVVNGVRKSVSWRTLETIVRLLVQDGQYDQAGQLVRDVHGKLNQFKLGIAGSSASEQIFWAYIDKLRASGGGGGGGGQGI